MGAARAGGRRPPLGRRGPARLPRPSGRLGDECAARPDLHGAARAARAAPDVGRARERGHDRARAAERRRDGHARRLPAAADAGRRPSSSEALLARAEGNPLYAEEFVRMLVDRGFLYRNGGGWQLREGELPLPESVQGIIAARIDALAAGREARAPGRGRDRPRLLAGLRSPRSAASSARKSDTSCGRSSRKSSSGVSARAPSRASSSTRSATRSSATSRTGRSPVQSERGGTCSRRSWIESLGRREDHAETLAHHYLAAVEYAEAGGRGELLLRRPGAEGPTRGGRSSVVAERVRNRSAILPRRARPLAGRRSRTAGRALLPRQGALAERVPGRGRAGRGARRAPRGGRRRSCCRVRRDRRGAAVAQRPARAGVRADQRRSSDGSKAVPRRTPRPTRSARCRGSRSPPTMPTRRSSLRRRRWRSPRSSSSTSSERMR